MAIKHFDKAKKVKNNEFYTQYEDIEKEMIKVRDILRDKVVYLPCDNEDSNFYKFFKSVYKEWGIRAVIATHIEKPQSYKLILSKNGNVKQSLDGDGDMFSEECLTLLDQSDIVITNPPFSYEPKYTRLLLDRNKDFILIAPITNIQKTTYKEYLNGKIKLSTGRVKKFIQPDGTIKDIGNTSWITTLDYEKPKPFINLTKKYNEVDYPKLDNVDAINVNRTANIPCDYDGLMAVPITFLEKYTPDQFEIIDMINSYTEYGKPHLNGKEIFMRILIKKRSVQD